MAGEWLAVNRKEVGVRRVRKTKQEEMVSIK